MEGKMSRSIVVILVLSGFCSACAPEVGSKAWCEQMSSKPKGDWSLNEATEFAKSCILEPDEGR